MWEGFLSCFNGNLFYDLLVVFEVFLGMCCFWFRGWGFYGWFCL